MSEGERPDQPACDDTNLVEPSASLLTSSSDAIQSAAANVSHAHALLAVDVEDSIHLLRSSLAHLRKAGLNYQRDWTRANLYLADALSQFRRQSPSLAADLKEAVLCYRNVLASSSNEVETADVCNRIGATLQRISPTTYERLSDSIESHRRACDLSAQSDRPIPDHYLLNLGKALLHRYEHFFNRPVDAQSLSADINEAISVLQQVVARRSPTGDTKKWLNAIKALIEAHKAFARERPAAMLDALACHNQITQLCPQQLVEEHIANLNDMSVHLLETYVGDRDELCRRAIDAARVSLRLVGDQSSLAWAKCTHSLGYALCKYSRLDARRTDLLKEGMECYGKALRAFSEKGKRYFAACTAMNLAIAIRNSPTGDNAENCSEAIGLYNMALSVLTREKYPADFALTNLNLGATLLLLPTENRIVNISKALDCFENAGSVIKEKTQPVEWARLQVNMGIANLSRGDGDILANVEASISNLKNALRIRRVLNVGVDTAIAELHLANAFLDRRMGDQIQNIEESIRLYENALRVLTKASYPRYWAKIQKNLGTLYTRRFAGDLVENRKRSISYLEAASEIQTKETSPFEFADLKLALGNSYRFSSEDSKKEGLVKSVEQYEKGLSIVDRRKQALSWVEFKAELGGALQGLALHDDEGGNDFTRRRDYLCKARENFDSALEVITPADHLHYYGMVSRKLTWNLLQQCRLPASMRASRSELLQEAVMRSEAGVKAFSTSPLTREYIDAVWAHANVMDELNQRAKAIELLEHAKDTLQQIQYLSDAGVLHSRLLSIEYSKIYSHLFRLYLQKEEDTRKALETCEQAKASLLRETIAVNYDISALLPDERSKTKFFNVRSELQRCQFHLDQLSADRYEERQSLRKDLHEYGLVIRGFYEQAEKRSPRGRNVFGAVLSWEECLGLIKNDTICVLFFFNEEDMGSEDHGLVEIQYLNAIVIWQRQLRVVRHPMSNPALGRMAESFRNGTTDESLNEQRYLQELGTLFDDVISQICTGGKPFPKGIVIVPHLGLHKIPFIAVPCKNIGCSTGTAKGNVTLGSIFPRGVIVLPSLSVGKRLRNEAPDWGAHANVAAVTGPHISKFEQLTSRITGNGAEEQLFKKPGLHLYRRKATVKNVLHADCVKNCDILHMTCHGHFGKTEIYETGELAAMANPSAILDNSGLELCSANQRENATELLTLRDIWGLRLQRCHLAVIVACSGGVVNNLSTSDECLGIGYAFLAAGAQNVVCSLWPVNETVSAVVISKFYENLTEMGTKSDGHWDLKTVSGCLVGAQIWYRSLSSPDGQKTLRKYLKKLGFQDESAELPDCESFYNWAGFQVIGPPIESADSPTEYNVRDSLQRFYEFISSHLLKK